jgi:hypothetical protein
MDSLNSFVEFVGAISPVVFFLSLLFLLFGFYKIRASHKETPRDVRVMPEILRDVRAMPEILRDVRAAREKFREDALGAPEILRDVRASKLPVLRKKSTLRKVVEFMGNVELD